MVNAPEESHQVQRYSALVVLRLLFSNCHSKRQLKSSLCVGMECTEWLDDEEALYYSIQHRKCRHFVALSGV